ILSLKCKRPDHTRPGLPSTLATLAGGTVLRRRFFFLLGRPGASAVGAVSSALLTGHPNYNDPPYANDLMLIKLNESVMESSTIRRIPVASQCPTPGDTCLVSGWGRLRNGKLASLLQCVNLSVVAEETCRLLYDPVYHLSMFCAGGGLDRKDTCNGDSGGPIVCNRSLQGLVSMGQGECGQPGIPSVYTNLCKFTNWIQTIIQTS
ncbi:hypothetical protein STEG23_018870, partial [Scotinomys teguina]